MRSSIGRLRLGLQRGPRRVALGDGPLSHARASGLVNAAKTPAALPDLRRYSLVVARRVGVRRTARAPRGALVLSVCLCLDTGKFTKSRFRCGGACAARPRAAVTFVIARLVHLPAALFLLLHFCVCCIARSPPRRRRITREQFSARPLYF